MQLTTIAKSLKWHVLCCSLEEFGAIHFPYYFPPVHIYHTIEVRVFQSAHVAFFSGLPAYFSFAEVTMNCRSEVLEISVEGRQIEEAMLALLHTILLHRSTGKFHYKKEGTYSIGTVGTQDVDCDFIDFTYVRVSSEELDRALRKAVGEFKVKVTVFISE